MVYSYVYMYLSYYTLYRIQRCFMTLCCRLIPREPQSTGAATHYSFGIFHPNFVSFPSHFSAVVQQQCTCMHAVQTPIDKVGWLSCHSQPLYYDIKLHVALYVYTQLQHHSTAMHMVAIHTALQPHSTATLSHPSTILTHHWFGTLCYIHTGTNFLSNSVVSQTTEKYMP